MTAIVANMGGIISQSHWPDVFDAESAHGGTESKKGISRSQEFRLFFVASRIASRPLAELTEALTPREGEFLQMLVNGPANKGIAAPLTITEQTVIFHVESIPGMLGAGSRTEAVFLGILHGGFLRRIGRAVRRVLIARSDTPCNGTKTLIFSIRTVV